MVVELPPCRPLRCRTGLSQPRARTRAVSSLLGAEGADTSKRLAPRWSASDELYGRIIEGTEHTTERTGREMVTEGFGETTGRDGIGRSERG